MHAQGLGDAGAEAIGLNQRAHQRADVVNPGAVHQVAQSFGAGLTGAHLEVDQMEFVAEIGVGVVQILANAHQGLIEGEPRFDADYGEVECVRQAEANTLLAVSDHALQNQARQEKTETGNAHQQKQVIETGKQSDRREAGRRHQNARAKIIVDVHGIAKSGLNQPGARARYIRRRKRDGSANGIDCLFDAFSEGGLVLGLLLLSATEGAQTSAQQGTGSQHGRAEGKDRPYHGDENDGDQDQRQHVFKPGSG